MSAEYDKYCIEFDKLYNKIVIEALEIAFQEIDNEKQQQTINNNYHKDHGDRSSSGSPVKNRSPAPRQAAATAATKKPPVAPPKLVKDFDELQAEIDPIYENIDEILEEDKGTDKVDHGRADVNHINDNQINNNDTESDNDAECSAQLLAPKRNTHGTPTPVFKPPPAPIKGILKNRKPSIEQPLSESPIENKLSSVPMVTTTSVVTTTPTPKVITPQIQPRSTQPSPVEPKSSVPTPIPPPTPVKQQQVTEEKVIEEPYYQVPTSEPYYEVPKMKPVPFIPLYENIDMLGNAAASIETKVFEPPKEKPPPPPIEDESEEEEEDIEPANVTQRAESEDVFRRVNSTKRIKKEIRNKRSSFLGIEGVDDDSFLEINVAPPPDMAAFLEEERRLERQLLLKAGFSDSSDAGDSRDSGVSENHSRQSSGPYSSEENENEPELLMNLPQQNIGTNSHYTGTNNGDQTLDDESRFQQIEKQIREQENNYHNRIPSTTTTITTSTVTNQFQLPPFDDDTFDPEEVLRVERELLQLEQEELKRQRENLLYRENLARFELNHGAKMLMSANEQQLNQPTRQQQQSDLVATNGGQNFANVPNNNTYQQHQIYQVETDYRKSMPDLQYIMDQKRLPPAPPAKPLRAQFQQEYVNMTPHTVRSRFDLPEPQYSTIAPQQQPHVPQPPLPIQSRLQTQQPVQLHMQQQPAAHYTLSHIDDNFVQLRHNPALYPVAPASQPITNKLMNGSSNGGGSNVTSPYANMTRHTLHALSATPKPKLTNDWVQHRRSEHSQQYPQQQQSDLYQELYRQKDPYLRQANRMSDAWLQNQQKRKSDPLGGASYNNSHWLIQEAEQRRLEQQRGVKSTAKKPLPDSVIQTITQRVQSLGLGERRRQTIEPNLSVSNGDLSQMQPQDPNDRILSVSGKKKCSHCGIELGRGAAMIIESLRLFYHIDCFKCSVCHSSLGDGRGGTDVRVRNSRLHCQHCYSSDDGVKYSCV